MAISLIQHAKGVNATTCTVTSTGAGRCILVFISGDGTAIVSGVTDNATGGSATYTQVPGAYVKMTDGGGWGALDLWICQSSKAGATTITAAGTAGAIHDLFVFEIAGLDTSAALDVVRNGYSTGNLTVNGYGVTTTNANDIVLTAHRAHLSSPIVTKADATFTLGDTTNTYSNWGSSYYIASATGTYTPSWNQPNEESAAITVALKAATGAGSVSATGTAGEGGGASGSATQRTTATGSAGGGEAASGSATTQLAGTGSAGSGAGASGAASEQLAATGTAGEGGGATAAATSSLSATGTAGEAAGATAAGSQRVDATGTAGEAQGAQGAATEPGAGAASGSAGSGSGASGTATVATTATGSAGEGESVGGVATERLDAAGAAGEGERASGAATQSLAGAGTAGSAAAAAGAATETAPGAVHTYVVTTSIRARFRPITALAARYDVEAAAAARYRATTRTTGEVSA